MNIAVYARSTNDNISPEVQSMFRLLFERKINLLFYEPYFLFAKNKIGLPASPATFDKNEQLKNSGVDYLLSLGGDGTLLETISLIKDSGIPVFGVNTGRLGFLASVSKENIKEAVDALLDKQFTLDKRTLLSLQTSNKLFGELNFALNEITVLKKDSATMMTIHAYLNGEFLNSYWGDGLIISTPTGSTAYSLSCGGPILMPETENFIITPIAPHNLNVRPIVIPDRYEIMLKAEGRNPNYLVSLDSRSSVIDSRSELIIRKAPFNINLVKFHKQDFLDTIRNKLIWGLDKRN